MIDTYITKPSSIQNTAFSLRVPVNMKRLALSMDSKFDLIKKLQETQISLRDAIESIKTKASYPNSRKYKGDNGISIFPSFRLISSISETPGNVTSLCITGDSSLVISGNTDHTISIWSLARNHLIARLIGHTTIVQTLCISNDDSLNVSRSKGPSIRVWSF
jgi:WD40 repeat protein